MSRLIVAREIAGRLRTAEGCIDAAIAAVGDLAAALPGAGERVGLAAGAGQDVLESTGEAFTLLLRSRAGLTRAHGRLAVLARALGLDDPAIGPLDKPEEDPPREGGVTPLRRAAGARLARAKIPALPYPRSVLRFP